MSGICSWPVPAFAHGRCSHLLVIRVVCSPHVSARCQACTVDAGTALPLQRDAMRTCRAHLPSAPADHLRVQLASLQVHRSISRRAAGSAGTGNQASGSVEVGDLARRSSSEGRGWTEVVIIHRVCFFWLSRVDGLRNEQERPREGDVAWRGARMSAHVCRKRCAHTCRVCTMGSSGQSEAECGHQYVPFPLRNFFDPQLGGVGSWEAHVLGIGDCAQHAPNKLRFFRRTDCVTLASYIRSMMCGMPSWFASTVNVFPGLMPFDQMLMPSAWRVPLVATPLALDSGCVARTC